MSVIKACCSPSRRRSGENDFGTFSTTDHGTIAAIFPLFRVINADAVFRRIGALVPIFGGQLRARRRSATFVRLDAAATVLLSLLDVRSVAVYARLLGHLRNAAVFTFWLVFQVERPLTEHLPFLRIESEFHRAKGKLETCLGVRLKLSSR